MALRGLGSTGLLCAGLLAGCTLGSDQPFIPRGDTVPGLADGDYQRFMIAGPAKMPAAIRRDCVTPGYVFPMPDERGKRRNRQVQPTYCPYDGAQRLPLIRLAREGDGYWLTAPDRRLNIRFKLLRHGIYLVQSDDPEGDGLRYGYALTREAPGGIDMALLNCDYFPALKSIHQTDTANAAEEVAIEPETAPAPEPSAAPGPREVLPSQHGDCRAPSLAAIQPELDRVVDRFAQGREIVWFLLRRVA